MIKLISFIVLTHFFQFNHLKILRQPRLLTFKLNQQYIYIYILYIYCIYIYIFTVIRHTRSNTVSVQTS